MRKFLFSLFVVAGIAGASAGELEDTAKGLALAPEADLSFVTKDWNGGGFQMTQEVAQFDAQFYFEDQHPSKADIQHKGLDIGEAHGLKHHLVGKALNEYALDFEQTLEALSNGK